MNAREGLGDLEAPEGCRWEWVPDEQWAIWQRPPRRRRPHWWSYCEDHMYGRIIRDGVVLHRVAVLTNDPSDQS